PECHPERRRSRTPARLVFGGVGVSGGGCTFEGCLGRGKPFDRSRAREAGLRSAEVRRQRAQRRADGRGEVSADDEARSVDVLRGLLESVDERTRKDAAIKVLEYAKGRPKVAAEDEQPTKIIFETAARGGCPKCSCARCRRIFPRGENGQAD